MRWRDDGPEWPLERKEDSQCELCSVECPDKPDFSSFLSNLP
jgi:hypothetical protein